jgi:phage gpG-like protein
MIFNVTLLGADEVIAALEQVPGAVRSSLERAVEELAIRLRQHIKGDKLEGQVLHHRSGALTSSIMQESPIIEGSSVIGKVYSTGDVKYAAVHEYGLTVSKVSKLGKPFTVTYPERSFMRSSLEDMRNDISTALRDAVMAGLQQPFGGE